MKKQLTLTVDQAKAMLGKDTSLDELIKANFTAKELCVNIIDQIDSLQAALDYNGKTLERFLWETERDTDQQKATKELEEIATALKEGKELEMGDYWYYPYFRKPAGSGSGFSFDDCSCDHVGSAVGSRLCVDSSEKATYMGNQFTSIYTRHLSPKTN